MRESRAALTLKKKNSLMASTKPKDNINGSQ